MRRSCLLAMAVMSLMVLCLSNSALATIRDIYDPGGLSSAVNSQNRLMQGSTGNYTILQLNANSNRIVFNFDAGDWNNLPLGDQLYRVFLTQVSSGLDLTVFFDSVAPYGRIRNNAPTYASSGEDTLAYNTGTTQQAVFRFNKNVYGVAMILSRLYEAFTVTLYDVNNNIITTDTILPTGAEGFSFYGYYNPVVGEIRKVVLNTSAQGGNQWWLDDFTVIPQGGDLDDLTPPTPNPMTWESLPQTLDSYTVTMTASPAGDPSGVEYYFEEITGNQCGADSGWQVDRTFTCDRLKPNTSYEYRVKARDTSAHQNETAYSVSVAVTTDIEQPDPARGAVLPDVSTVTGAQLDENFIHYTLYVSVDGDDLNPGTESLPLRTVNVAALKAGQYQLLNKGTRIIIGPGTYRELIDGLISYPTHPNATAPIIFEAAQTGAAILSGADIYTGWSRLGASDIYEHNWAFDWGPVGDYTGLDNYMIDVFEANPVLRRREMFFANGLLLRQYMTYSEMASQVNSFYVDEGADKVWIHLPSGADINTMTIEAAVRQYVLHGIQNSNLVFRGLVFEKAATNMLLWENGALHLEATVDYNCHDILLEDNTFRWNNGTGWCIVGRPDDVYSYIYHPGEDITVRRNVCNYNGTAGFMTHFSRNSVYEDIDTSYNNWRGQWGNLTWGWTGSRFYRAHRIIVRRIRAVENYSRGVWFDFDGEDILLEDSYMCNNIDGLKFEVVQGPTLVKNCRMSDNSSSGLLVRMNENLTLEDCVITNNGGSQISITSDTVHYIGNNWERHYPDTYLYLGKWTMVNNVIGGQGHITGRLLKGPASDHFFDTLLSDNNYWYQADDPNVFVVGPMDYHYDQWQCYSRQDWNSTWDTSEPVPAFCGDFGTVYSPGDLNRDCKVNLADYADIADAWGQEVCTDPTIPWRQDVNHDCLVDLKDIQLFGQYWLESTIP